MNVVKAYEMALAQTIRQSAGIAADTVIRCWQTLTNDQLWNAVGVDHSMPAVVIRATPPRTLEDQVTCECDAQIEIQTDTAADKYRSDLSEIYSKVQAVLDKLFAQWKAGTGTEFTGFTAAMAAAIGVSSTVYSFGGFTFGEAVAPIDDDGMNAISVAFVLHFSRSDFL